ncbi:MAG TPA: winged helix-turn-helix transcriptional regulator, partial [Candidatus Aenigmarchaeota archaeon]|nr:winged helix-turn-helix transcriptional regulator [Candidatus Aenigmarchaeota archaeon]
MLEIKIDEKDKEILRILQSNCRMSTKAIANKLNMPVTTLYSKIKRLEHLKVIK